MEKKLNILLLEDAAADAELVERELVKAKIDFVARRVETQEEFIRHLAEFQPNIILADYSLPQFTALDALRLLKERKSEVPFILVTGSHSEEVAVECMKEGADDYILKASLRRLPSALRNTISKKEAEREKLAVAAASFSRSASFFEIVLRSAEGSRRRLALRM